VDDERVQAGLAALAEAMTSSGHLRSPRWREAFHAVHRHVFVPRFWRDEEPGAFPARWRMIDSATADHDEWLAAVYSDRSLPTELLGVPTAHGMHPLVTSSTTMPSLVMAMLEALDVDEPAGPAGDAAVSVLEIGTATGYNAALLCEGLGEDRVTTVDISPELAALARVRLAAHGYHPHVVAGDGADGVPERAPFDRIIATCGLDHVPPAWLVQTRPGGRILLNLVGPFHAFALLLLDVDAHGHAVGRFLTQSGGFMLRRTDPTRAADYTVPITRPDTAATTTATAVDPTQLYRRGDWGLLAQSCAPEVISRQVYLTDPDPADPDAEPPLATELATRDGASWAQIHHDPGPDGAHAVTQAGPRRLWDEIEALHATWTAAGRPDRSRWRVLVDPTGATTLRIDENPPVDARSEQTAAAGARSA
jgi:protein-L-isoaspartate(D-aspartate) O-methyltransferase